MKKIKSYLGNPFEFHKKVVNSLNVKSEEKKLRIKSEESTINTLYLDYSSKFQSHDLVNLSRSPYRKENQLHDNLISLYTSSRKDIKDLRLQLTTDDNNILIDTCPNCTIDKESSLDHIIPKEEFPEYSVNPINLIPCCSTCNSKKNKYWKKSDGKLKFLNLYSTELPDVRYLFVSCSSKEDYKFEIQNPNGIPSELFEVILSHYDNLELLHRFKKASGSILSELETTIESNKEHGLNNQIIRSIVLSDYSKRSKINGVNYWKTVLVESIIDYYLFV